MNNAVSLGLKRLVRVEALMGHEGYLTEVYRRYSIEDFAKFYEQAEASVAIFMDFGEMGRLKTEMNTKNTQLKNLVNGLTAENLELKARLAKVELQQTKLLEGLKGWYKRFIERLRARLLHFMRLTK